MSIIVIDLETYYDKDYSLSKMTTEEYINDPRFEVIGMGIKVDDDPTKWFTGDDVGRALHEVINWSEHAILCHNTLFDGAILAWKYGVKPGFWLDTLCMARATHGVDAGGSLAKLVTRYGLGEKGTEVINALGKRATDFTAQELHRYGEYCKNDADLTYKLFNILAQGFPDNEFSLIDMTLRMYTEPALTVDDALLVDRLEEIKQDKSDLLAALMNKLECDTEEAVRAKLASNKQFAMLLGDLGIDVPTKISPTTGKPTYALAKNDEGFIALTEHEDLFIQQLCAVRLGTKSTIEESRVARFIDIGARNRGRLPIPLKYYGAHTGRWAGSDKVNFQNLPSRDKKKKALKNAIMAAPDHVVVNCDSSQIEARVLAWWAGQDDVVAQFANGDDVYSIFASKIYNQPISKANPIERFVGKTCIAEGSLVLCESGWKRIETVTTKDHVWDGEEWVCHSGIALNGTKKTLQISGLWLTPDHQVWSGTWHRADYLLQDGDTLSRALDIAAANYPLPAIWLAPEESGRLSSVATVTLPSTQSITTTSKILDRLAAIYARSKQQIKNAIGSILRQCQTIPTGHGYSTASPQPLHAATLQLVDITNTMVSVGLLSAKAGERTVASSYGTYKLYMDGTTLRTRWTELMSMGRTLRATSGSYQDQTICETNERSQTLKPVYDILNCGSRNRFTVLTDRGPIIVHNCILGLGYGTGAEKLRHTLKTQPPGADLPIEQCKDIVQVYRSANYRIPELWQECDTALKVMMSGKFEPFYLGGHKCVQVTPEGIRLPNGLYIRYPGLRYNDEGKIVYDSRKGPVYIWGGTVVENVVQALARIAVGEQLLAINPTYPVRLTVHDAGVWTILKSHIENASKFIIGKMSTAPDWAPGLPVACELKYAERYGEC